MALFSENMRRFSRKQVASAPAGFAAPIFYTGQHSSNIATVTTSTPNGGVVSGLNGQRLVIAAAYTRGSAGGSSSSRALTNISGTADFAAFNLASFTVHENLLVTETGSVNPVRLVIASHVLDADRDGILTVTWGGAVWHSVLAAFCLEACTLLESEGEGSETLTTIENDYASSFNGTDFMVALAAQLLGGTPTAPAGLTQQLTRSGGNHFFEIGSRNGSLTEPISWSNFTSFSLPRAVASAVFRKT